MAKNLTGFGLSNQTIGLTYPTTGGIYYDNRTRSPWFDTFSRIIQHDFRSNSIDGRCNNCGHYLLKMVSGQFVHRNLTVNVRVPVGDYMNYEIQTYAPDPEEFAYDYSEPTRRRSPKTMPFNQLSQLLQRARQDHNLLDQDEVWVNRDGIKVLLKDMSARYASNVLAWLRKASEQYHSSWATWEFITKYADQDATDFEEFLDDQTTDAKAKAWMKETKLYKALMDISKHSV